MKKIIVIIFTLLIILQGTGCSLNSMGGFIERKVKDDVYLEGENVGGMREPEVRSRILNYARSIDTNAKNACMDDVTWQIKESEAWGRKVNMDKTLETIYTAKKGSRVSLCIEEIKPQVMSAALANNIIEIGKFSTPIIDDRESRINNIHVAAEYLDYHKVAPGEEFSFNRVLGKRSANKGYEWAPIIIKTEEGYKRGYGIGGGVCQLSTTLYNAVEMCGLNVTERHIHSKNIGYVPRGQDATVSYGSVDFKFKNNREHTIMIRAFLTDSDVTVKILENRN